MILLPEPLFMSIPGRANGWQDDVAMDSPMFKGAGGTPESAADGLASTESSPQNPGSSMKMVSRVRQKFPRGLDLD